WTPSMRIAAGHSDSRSSPATTSAARDTRRTSRTSTSSRRSPSWGRTTSSGAPTTRTPTVSGPTRAATSRRIWVACRTASAGRLRGRTWRSSISCPRRGATEREDRRDAARKPVVIDSRVQDLLDEVGLKPSPGVEATIVGHDPVLAYRFPVGEAAAMALAAGGVAVWDLWELRGGRPQRARVEVRRAAASLHSRDYLSLNGGPAPLSPASGNPLVDLYRCRDGRWVHVHGALPNL